MLKLLMEFPGLAAPAASLGVWLAAKFPAFPFEGRTKLGILGALFVASVLIEFALAWANGGLANFDFAKAGKTLADAVEMLAVAYAGHTAIKEVTKAAKEVMRWVLSVHRKVKG